MRSSKPLSHALQAFCFLLILSSCSQPAFLYREQRVKYELVEKDGVIYSTSGADSKSMKPERTDQGVVISWGVAVQNAGTLAIEIKPSWTKVRLEKKVTSAQCVSVPGVIDDLLKMPVGSRAKITCSLTLNSSAFPELLTSDRWLSFEIPYTRDGKELWMAFQYKVNAEDFQK